MRELKFRAWCEKYKVMFPNVWPFFGKWVIEIYDGGGWDERNDCDFIIMQSTGVKDRNGREIYEGDILAIEEPKFNFINYTRQEFAGYETIYKMVRYRPENGGYITESTNGISSLIACAARGEIAGNIYENPDLVKLGTA